MTGANTLPDLVRHAEPAAPRRFAVHSPLDGSVLGDAPDCGAEEARRALDRAVAASAAWRHTTAWERAAILRRWLELLHRHETELARLITREMGKPLSESVGELRYSAGFIEWYAEEARRVYGETIPSQFPHKRLLVLRQPAGIVLGITAWNFPHATVTRKVAPALAAGCTFILKPSEQTPLSALCLASLWQAAGGPEGTFQVLPALDPDPVSSVLLDDPRVRVLAFTGSTAVGMKLYARCAPTMKRLALELGGHAPFLVFPDADLDAAVRDVIACKFRNGGQTCVCTNRIYLHRKISAEFLERFTHAVASLPVGDPLDPATRIGPLVNARALAKVQDHIADATRHGAQVLTGGTALRDLYFPPTVLTGITPAMRLMREETFGPVAPVLEFSSDAEAVALANDTTYGLAAYLWTRDLGRAFRVAESLDFGIVGINDSVASTPQAPLGGIKYSGLGREGGKWGIDEFLDTKYLSVGLPDPVE